MDDEIQSVPDNGSAEAQPESGQTAAAVVAPEPTTTPSLSLTDVEKLVDAREAKLRAEFEARERKNQSKSDKAYAAALAKAKVIEENADLLGLDAEGLKNAKQAVIDKEFAATFAKPDEPEPTPTYQPAPSFDEVLVSESEIQDALAKQGITDSALLEKYKGRNRNDPNAWTDWEDDLAVAKASAVQKKREQQQQKQQAAQAAKVKADVGRVNPVPANGAPAQGYDPVTEIEKMMAEGTPDSPTERMKYLARLDRLQKEAGWV